MVETGFHWINNFIADRCLNKYCTGGGRFLIDCARQSIRKFVDILLRPLALQRNEHFFLLSKRLLTVTDYASRF